jgi:hypothetical protein
MPTDLECYVYVVPPGSTEFVTAGRFLLQPAEAEAILRRIFTTVASSWEASLREASVSPGDCQRLSRAFLYPGLELDPELEG